MLRYMTSGESHGQALTAIVEGFPAGVTLDTTVIDRELERRQGGYGRGKRQTLETDRVIVDAGIYHGVTTGGPITLRLVNRDAKLERLIQPPAPRGGHVDLAGAINYQTGIRQVLERASARETAMRVAVGGLARLLLTELGIDVFGYVIELGGIAAPPLSLDLAVRDASPVYTLNPEADAQIVAAIDAAQKAGDTVGGVVEAVVTGCPIGLGTHAQWDRKLDARLAAAVMSIQAIKGVEIGLGFEAARRPGSKVMDPIRYDPDHPASDRRFGFRRPSNNAGGIEGGTSNGEPIVVRAGKKPISTLAARGPSINMATKAESPAAYERSDVCAVPAASVIVEAVVAFEVASAIVDKYVGTSLDAIRTSMAAMHELNREHLAKWADQV
ncbi:Chorismate synthase [Aquisphaera giovannonii]|uniref:Chorismate synthase n=1 Tax=Aquisphaera giovannonii TaxID=406548 RepID=A0A5B9WDB3_9BACT|nr:chorismate synthase [Aquisphaera giovannonii]QEH38507.1 Chorismate synthase [Aquisphaera giovannonii]